MSNSRPKAFKGTGKASTVERCAKWRAIDHCGTASKQQIAEVADRLRKANPNWPIARCAQRARVVVYLGRAG